MPMTMSSKRLIKESRAYEKNVKNYGSIEKYYGLTDKRFKIKRTKINIGEDVFEMSFVRCAQSYPLSTTLNKYILREINEFAKECIYVKVKVIQSVYYPVNPPMWSVQACESNIMSNISIYFEYVLKEHFIIHEEQWSPAITFSTDLYDIIVKVIDGFKYILTTQNKVMYLPTEVPRISNLLCAI